MRVATQVGGLLFQLLSRNPGSGTRSGDNKLGIPVDHFASTVRFWGACGRSAAASLSHSESARSPSKAGGLLKERRAHHARQDCLTCNSCGLIQGLESSLRCLEQRWTQHTNRLSGDLQLENKSRRQRVSTHLRSIHLEEVRFNETSWGKDGVLT